jgi:CRP-like cAMP-binding protein
VQKNNVGRSLAPTNAILSSFPHDQFELLSPYMTRETFEQGVVLVEAGDEIDFVYFPYQGVVSLLSVLKDGRAVEIATVGQDGVIGAMTGLGFLTSFVRVVVQLPLEATKIPANRFRRATTRSDAMRGLCLRYNEVLFSQARISAACNAVHLIEARFCRWLLQTANRAGTKTVNLTQELVAELMGVRRTSITEVATKLQAAGVVHYSRGVINILDATALEKLSCECYSLQRDQAEALR